MHRIFDRRSRTNRGRAGRLLMLVALVPAVYATVPAVNAMPASAQTQSPLARTAAACPGRLLLTCWEKIQTFNDDVTWTHAAVLDLEPFETRVPLHLNNPALAQFWRFEAATAGARSVYEYTFQSEITDNDFEAIPTVPSLPRPGVHRHRIVDRRTAAAMSRLMRAELSEVLNLKATVTALNRATEATYQRGRSDWLAWQLSAAARFARRTANAVGAVIHDERAVSRAFTRHHLLFGIGAEDLKLGQRRIRKHGLNSSVRATMQSIGMDALTIAFVVHGFETASFGQYSFSLTQFLSQRSTIAGERDFQAALRHFAARIPATSQPPS